MTVMLRLENVTVPPLTLYPRVKVCDPAVVVTNVDVLPCETKLTVRVMVPQSPVHVPDAAVLPKANARRSSDGKVLSTEKLANPVMLLLPGATCAVTITKTLVPVVNVTDGLVGVPVQVTA
jgi:hypothetical protein